MSSMRHLNFLLVLLIVRVAMPSGLCAKSLLKTDGHDQRETILFSADRTEVSLTKEGVIKRYFGNIVATYKNITLNAERASYYGARQRVEFAGNASIKDLSAEARADSIVYLIDEETAIAEGNIVAEDDRYRIEADRLTYYRNIERMSAEGDVRLTDLKTGTTVKGQHAEYALKAKKAVVTRAPVLIKEMESKEDKLIITAKQIELDGRNDEAVALKDVCITKGRVTAVAEEVIYREQESRLLLRNGPKIFTTTASNGTSTHNVLEGEQIEMVMESGRVKKVIASGSARGRSVEEDSSNVSELGGQRITIEIEGEELQRMLVEGNATSIHYSIKNDGRDVEMNEVSGDRIGLFFKDGKIHRVLVEGGAMGTYYPPEKNEPQRHKDAENTERSDELSNIN